MYKLLLVSKSKEVRKAFSGIQDMNRLMFDPVALADSAEEALAFLKKPGADAIAMDLPQEEAAQLHKHLEKSYPHLPIMRVHRKRDAVRNELTMLREVLDQLHGDFSDSENDAPMVLSRLENDTLHKLLQERLASREELASRLQLSRSSLAAKRPCLLFEFDLPDGASFLEHRWSHGFDRLELSLRANFFGRLQGSLVYATALLSPLRLRVLASPVKDISEKELDRLSTKAHKEVLDTAQQVKDFMDLDMVCTQFRVLSSLDDLIAPLK